MRAGAALTLRLHHAAHAAHPSHAASHSVMVIVTCFLFLFLGNLRDERIGRQKQRRNAGRVLQGRADHLGRIDNAVFDKVAVRVRVGVVAFGLAFELAARRTGDTAYRAAAAVVLAAAFLLVWLNLAVGIIGSEDNPANLMFGGVLAVGIAGAALARFRPDGMARAMVATAFAQALAGAMAVIAGWGSTAQVLSLTVFFAALWLLSAWLFRKAARGGSSAGGAAPQDRRAIR